MDVGDQRDGGGRALREAARTQGAEHRPLGERHRLVVADHGAIEGRGEQGDLAAQRRVDRLDGDARRRRDVPHTRGGPAPLREQGAAGGQHGRARLLRLQRPSGRPVCPGHGDQPRTSM